LDVGEPFSTPEIFSKPRYASTAEYFDNITSTVALTRNDNGMLYNYYQQSAGYALNSPTGTFWSYKPSTDTADFTAFQNSACSSTYCLELRSKTVSMMTIGSTETRIYDVEFTDWTTDDIGGGGFDYIRSLRRVCAAGKPTTLHRPPLKDKKTSQFRFSVVLFHLFISKLNSHFCLCRR
jgi:hypothetical protein